MEIQHNCILKTILHTKPCKGNLQMAMGGGILKNRGVSQFLENISSPTRERSKKEAGAELRLAQLRLGFGFD